MKFNCNSYRIDPTMSENAEGITLLKHRVD